MTDQHKTKSQLIAELKALRARLAAVEGSPDPSSETSGGHGATEAARENDRKFHDLVEGSVQGMLVHRDFSILFANQTLARMLGYESGEAMVGMDVASIAPPEELEIRRKYYAMRMANRDAPNHFEGGAIHKDGSRILLDFLATVVDWEGEPAVQVTMLDITERRRAEYVLRENERRMRLLTDAVPVMIAYIDAGLHFRFTSKSLQDWMASDAENIFGKHLGELVSPEAYALIKPHAERALQGEEIEYETVLPYPDGKTRRIHAIYIPDIDEHGEVKGFSAMAEDITESRRFEEELQASRHLLQTVFDAIPSRITVRDRNDRLTMANRAQVKGLNMTPEELVKLPEKYPLLSGQERSISARINQSVLKEGKTVQEERR